MAHRTVRDAIDQADEGQINIGTDEGLIDIGTDEGKLNIGTEEGRHGLAHIAVPPYVRNGQQSWPVLALFGVWVMGACIWGYRVYVAWGHA